MAQRLPLRGAEQHLRCNRRTHRIRDQDRAPNRVTQNLLPVRVDGQLLVCKGTRQRRLGTRRPRLTHASRRCRFGKLRDRKHAVLRRGEAFAGQQNAGCVSTVGRSDPQRPLWRGGLAGRGNRGGRGRTGVVRRRCGRHWRRDNALNAGQRAGRHARQRRALRRGGLTGRGNSGGGVQAAVVRRRDGCRSRGRGSGLRQVLTDRCRQRHNQRSTARAGQRTGYHPGQRRALRCGGLAGRGNSGGGRRQAVVVRGRDGCRSRGRGSGLGQALPDRCRQRHNRRSTARAGQRTGYHPGQRRAVRRGGLADCGSGDGGRPQAAAIRRRHGYRSRDRGSGLSQALPDRHGRRHNRCSTARTGQRTGNHAGQRCPLRRDCNLRHDCGTRLSRGLGSSGPARNEFSKAHVETCRGLEAGAPRLTQRNGSVGCHCRIIAPHHRPQRLGHDRLRHARFASRRGCHTRCQGRPACGVRTAGNRGEPSRDAGTRPGHPRRAVSRQ